LTWRSRSCGRAPAFPGWLLERRRRPEAAVVSVVATSYLLGVSTRRVEKLVQQLGITSLSKSQVSDMARDLDAQVEAFRTRPLDAGPYTFVAAGALVLKVREGGRIVNVQALVATGVNAEGYREILGLQVSSAHGMRPAGRRVQEVRGLSGAASRKGRESHLKGSSGIIQSPAWPAVQHGHAAVGCLSGSLSMRRMMCVILCGGGRGRRGW
jgi:putative transposase